MNTSDPIIAVIEAHRRAWTVTRAAYERQGAIEDELGVTVPMPTGEVEIDPRWIAADDVAREALALQDDLAVKLLKTQPKTIAGAAALLTYYVDALTTTRQNAVFPEVDVNGQLVQSKSTCEAGKDFGYFVVRNVAAGLSNMAAACEVLDHGAGALQTGGQIACTSSS